MAFLELQQTLADAINCMGKTTSHFTVGDPHTETYDPGCDQTYLGP